MKKGFPADEATIGGRVRKSRLDTGYTIKDFAPLIGVSPNHLGLVERGEKQASFKLLQKIAEITDTPYQWLMKGIQQETKKTENPAAPVDKPEKLNLQLFFGLILTLRPAVSKEILAGLLSTSVDTINRILAGEDVEYGLQWPSRFPTLAGLLGDISEVRRQLGQLDQFLSEVDTEHTMNRIAENLIRYLYDRNGERYKLHQITSPEVESCVSEKDYKQYEFHWSEVTLYKTDNPKNLWHFRLLLTQKPVSDEAMEEIFGIIGDMANSMDENLTVLFTWEEDYESFDTSACNAIDRIATIDAGYDGMGMPSPVDSEYAYCNLSSALLDEKTWEVKRFDYVNPYANRKL